MRISFGMGVASPLCLGARPMPGGLIRPGDVGLWLDPSNLGSLSQDSAGSVPVTAVGQAVGRIADRARCGAHALQAMPGQRPVLAQQAGRLCLAFDGVDDGLATVPVAWNSDAVTLVAAVRKLSDTAAGCVVELGTNASSAAGFGLFAHLTAGTSYGVRSYGSASAGLNGSGLAAPWSGVVTLSADSSADMLTMRLNGVQTGATAANQGDGGYGSQALNIGRRNGASLPFNGLLFGLFAVNRLLSPTELALVESWMQRQAGLA